MAGPGGGPPRKSHTKSRKGCKTCKRRHIRCDENFPQCRNCTKHNCRCDYMDQPAPEDIPTGSPGSDLLSDPQTIEQLRIWRTTGNAPFPELGPTSPSFWESFPLIDQMLLHHIASLSHDIHSRGYSKITVWASKMPIFLVLARSNEFVMSAVLALSASHRAWMTNSVEIQQLAYQHRGTALKGLHEAIGSFSKESSEAILAASILLSWQATEWRDWASLQQGVSTVLNAMRPWLHETELGMYLQEQRAGRGSRTPVIPSQPGPNPRVLQDDLARLDMVMSQLYLVQQRVSNDDELVQVLGDLSEFIRELKRDFPIQAPEQAFERLQKLRMWLFWLPPALLRPEDSDLGSIAVLSHFFGAALVIEPLFPEIGGSYFGNMATGPIDEMRTTLLTRQASEQHEQGLQVALSLTEFPYHTVMTYRARQQYLAQHSEPYASPQATFSPGHNFVSPYLPSESMSPYREDSMHSPQTNLTIPVPSPYLQHRPPSRPTSYASQSSRVSRSPTFEGPPGQHYALGTPTSTPGEHNRHPVNSPDQWYFSGAFSEGQRQHNLGTPVSPNELWI